MNDQQMAQIIVDTVERFDKSFPERGERVMLSAYGSLMAELAHQIKKNMGVEIAVEVLIEVVKTTSAGSRCEVTVHKYPAPEQGKAH